MKAWLRGFYYSLPIQLLFLHFRRYQVLLVFWFMLFSIVDGVFMKSFGADSLYLAPEYLGNVTAISFAIVLSDRSVRVENSRRLKRTLLPSKIDFCIDTHLK